MKQESGALGDKEGEQDEHWKHGGDGQVSLASFPPQRHFYATALLPQVKTVHKLYIHCAIVQQIQYDTLVTGIVVERLQKKYLHTTSINKGLFTYNVSQNRGVEPPSRIPNHNIIPNVGMI